MRDEYLTERQIESKEIFSGRLLHVFSDRIELPSKKQTGREYIRHVGAVCVIPITKEGEVVLERQFRYPMGKVLLEIPAGKLNSKEEPPEEAARRELKEETGIDAAKWTSLGSFYPAAAYSDEHIRMYMAEELTFGDSNLDDGEFLTVFRMKLDDLLDEIEKGNVPDGKTQCAALRAARLLGKR